jgi:tRNA (guanosine-2'-O-)-methyltransferase
LFQKETPDYYRSFFLLDYLCSLVFEILPTLTTDNFLPDQSALLEYLSSFITSNRKSRLEEVILTRTRYLSVVLENIYQSHNTSAVLRSCDCFGIQDIHIIEDQYASKTHPDIALGSDKWLNLYHYKKPGATEECLLKLKEQGYRIVATSPHNNSYDLETLPLDRKIALVFGTEMEGISSYVDLHTDLYVKIPMVGFTESLNISVSAAVCLYALSQRIRKNAISWELSAEEKTGVLLKWVKNTLKKPDILEREFCKNKPA